MLVFYNLRKELVASRKVTGVEWSPAGQLPGTGISLAKNVTIRWSARGLVLTVMLVLLLSTCRLAFLTVTRSAIAAQPCSY